MSREKSFEFLVLDSSGLWGSIRAVSTTERGARIKARKYLLENDVGPNGSLEADFVLEPRPKGGMRNLF